MTAGLYVDADGDGTPDRALAPGTVQIDLNGTGKLITVTPVPVADPALIPVPGAVPPPGRRPVRRGRHPGRDALPRDHPAGRVRGHRV